MAPSRAVKRESVRLKGQSSIADWMKAPLPTPDDTVTEDSESVHVASRAQSDAQERQDNASAGLIRQTRSQTQTGAKRAAFREPDGQTPLQGLGPRPLTPQASGQWTPQGPEPGQQAQDGHEANGPATKRRRMTTPRVVISPQPKWFFDQFQSAPTSSPVSSKDPEDPQSRIESETNSMTSPQASTTDTSVAEEAFESTKESTPTPVTHSGRPRRTTRRVSYREHVPAVNSSDDDVDYEEEEEQESQGDEYSGEEEFDNEETDEGHVEQDEGDEDYESEENQVRSRAAPKRKVAAVKAAEQAEAVQSQAQPSGGYEHKSKKRMATLTSGGSDAKQVDLSLPPLSDIAEIFVDITQKAIDQGLDKVLDQLQGRPLRVATMCSGTESPLLALELVRDALKNLGKPDLPVDHLFSAEIEPFKQAFIERNFHPPIIFRDIVELNKDAKTATTAYGARVEVPGGPDMLIAGTSCVDFSMLNRKQKGILEGGESGDTFHAVLAYIKQFRPPIVILENVFTAPWDSMLAMYEAEGYVAAGALLDTKNYYLPHTRQRGYMFCVRKTSKPASSRNPDPAATWTTLMEHFRRPASSSVSSFLLPNDHAQVINSRHRQAKQALMADERKEVDWGVCELRHVRYRQNMHIGTFKPFTDWQPSGILMLPDFADKSWFSSQVERVWDMVDCSVLRKALPRAGQYDVLYKTRIWNLSQNVDRFNDQSPAGVTSCITPSGIFYASDRGGPLTATECLRLQGLPLDKININTETDRQLLDLAGNAMSSTVIGSAILSAIISGFDAIDLSGREQAKAVEAVKPSTITGIDRLVDGGLGQAQSTADLAELMNDAARSSSRCCCEGQIALAEKPVRICDDCGHSACLSCGIKPAHGYPSKPLDLSREIPSDFVDKWRPRIPMSLKVTTTAAFRQSLEDLTVKDSLGGYQDAVKAAVEHDFRFSHFDRRSNWTICYHAPYGTLQLVVNLGRSENLHRTEWQLFAKPSADLPGNSALRKFLELPIGKSVVSGPTLFDNNWQWRIPNDITSNAQISGQGSKVPSWAARLHMRDTVQSKKSEATPKAQTSGPGKKVKKVTKVKKVEKSDKDDQVVSRAAQLIEKYRPTSKQTVWSQLGISMPGPLDQYVSGTYHYLPKCGTACESLYKREAHGDSPPVYLFLDPTRIGKPEEDTFVFAEDPSKLEYDQRRQVIARVEAEWRPWYKDGDFESPVVSIDSQWSAAQGVSVANSDTVVQLAHLPLPHTLLSQALQQRGCTHSSALFVSRLPNAADIKKPSISYKKITATDKEFFTSFAWAFERLRPLLEVKLTDFVLLQDDATCRTCAPPLPSLLWRSVTAGGKTFKIKPYEEPISATNYELALKARPDVFEIDFTLQDNLPTVKIGLNLLSLVERASAKLQASVPAGASVATVAWKLDTSYTEVSSRTIPNFYLQQNDPSQAFDPNKHFKKGLNIEMWSKQQQSLAWMLSQEDGAGREFVIEEAEEALLPYLGWRAEVRTQSKIHVRGGILADHAGFGKTITTLALIHSEFEKLGSQEIINNMKSPESKPGVPDPKKIAATLIVCPRTLFKQWQDEIKKVLGNCPTIAIEKIGELDAATEASFRGARIILVSEALFGTDSYNARISAYAGVPEPQKSAGRRELMAWLGYATDLILQHRNIPKAVDRAREIQSKQLAHERDETFQKFVPSKRLKGAKRAGGQTEGLGATTEKEPQKKQLKVNGCLLQMFHYNRIVVDEFTYLTKTSLASIASLKADKRWVLSATPAIRDPYDISHLANLIGIKLRVGSNASGVISSSNVAAMQEEMTDVELFRALQEPSSQAIQQRIYEIDQNFLDSFVRQNVQKFVDFAYHDYIVPVTLDMNHRIIYTEHSERLNSQDMRLKKGRKATAEGQDKEMKIFESSQKAISPEEVLSKVATCRPLINVSNKKIRSDQALIKLRQEECAEAKANLKASIETSQKQNAKIAEGDEFPFMIWQKGALHEGTIGDGHVRNDIFAMLKPGPGIYAPKFDVRGLTDADDEDLEHGNEEAPGPDGENDDGTEEPDAKKSPALVAARQLVADTSMKAKKYLSAVRSIRFTENAFKIQKKSVNRCDCHGCNGQDDSMGVSALCGHIFCDTCFDKTQLEGSICGARGCNELVKDYKILRASKMPAVTAAPHLKNDLGNKVNEVMNRLENIQRDNAQAILFVQSEEQLGQLQKLLEERKIRSTVVATETLMLKKVKQLPKNDKNDSSSKQSAAQKIEEFQKNKDPKTRSTVIVLNASNVSAAGINLANCSHVFFLSPLLKSTQYEYDAQMQQAIGRARRPGNTAKIHVYRIVALDTIDIDILEQRERRDDILFQTPDSSRMTAGEDAMAAFAREDWDWEGDEKRDKRRIDKEERTQLVKDVDGVYKLVPKSLLRERASATGIGTEGGSRIVGPGMDFTSLVKFSKTFREVE